MGGGVPGAQAAPQSAGNDISTQVMPQSGTGKYGGMANQGGGANPFQQFQQQQQFQQAAGQGVGNSYYPQTQQMPPGNSYYPQTQPQQQQVNPGTGKFGGMANQQANQQQPFQQQGNQPNYSALLRSIAGMFGQQGGAPVSNYNPVQSANDFQLRNTYQFNPATDPSRQLADKMWAENHQRELDERAAREARAARGESYGYGMGDSTGGAGGAGGGAASGDAAGAASSGEGPGAGGAPGDAGGSASGTGGDGGAGSGTGNGARGGRMLANNKQIRAALLTAKGVQAKAVPAHFSHGGAEKISVIHATPDVFDEFKTPKERGSKSSSLEANWLWFGEHDNADELTDMFGHRVAEAHIAGKPHEVNYKDYDRDTIYDPQVMEKILSDHKDKKAIKINGIALKEFGEPKNIYAVQDSSILSRPQWRKDWDIPVQHEVGDVQAKAVPGKSEGGDVAPGAARRLNDQGLYSHAAEAAAALPQAKGSPQQMLAMLSARGVKPDELKYSGAQNAFGGQKAVTKDELAQHFEQNVPEIQETVLRKNQAKYREHQLPGSGGTIDQKAKNDWLNEWAAEAAVNTDDISHAKEWKNASEEIKSWHLEEAEKAFNEKAHHDEAFINQFKSPAKKAEKYREILLHAPEKKENLNLIAQKMFGKNFGELPYEQRILVTSDPTASLGFNYTQSHWNVPNVLGHIRASDRDKGKTLHVEELQSDWGQDKRKGKGVPDHPLVGSTNAWTDLLLKRALREAASGEYDRMAWTPGEEQLKRFKNEGLVNYYDKIVPQRLTEIVKKLGHKAEITPHFIDTAEGEKSLHSIRMTPELRASIMRGLPVYKAGGSVGDPQALRNGGSPDDDRYREYMKRILRPSNPDLLELARQVNEGYKVGDYDYSGFKAHPVLPSAVKTTIGPLGNAVPKEATPLTWEQFSKIGKGGTLFTLGGDRSNLGRLTHVNGKELAWPVDLHAGTKYQQEPNPGVVWANDKKAATALRSNIMRAAEKGPVYGAFAPMGPGAVDSSKNMIDVLMSQISAGKVDSKAAKEFDDLLREGVHVHRIASTDKEKKRLIAAEKMQEWPGILSKEKARDFAVSKMTGTERAALVKLMDGKKWLQAGFPSISTTRAAITDPDIMHVSGNMMGGNIVELDPRRVAKDELAFEHSTYNTPTAGKLIGRVPFVERHAATPDFTQEQVTADYSTKAGDPLLIHPYSPNPGGRAAYRGNTEMRQAIQPINNRMLESIQEREEQKKLYGFKEGGVVDKALQLTRKART